jgi:hypothetical protein
VWSKVSVSQQLTRRWQSMQLADVEKWWLRLPTLADLKVRSSSRVASGRSCGVCKETLVPSVSRVDMMSWTGAVVVLDARKPDDFLKGHVPGSILLRRNLAETLLPLLTIPAVCGRGRTRA